MLSITSPQNPRVKRIVKLSERRARDEARQTVVEGVREIRQALDHGVVPVEAYMCPELIDGAEAERVAQHLRATAATGMSELLLVSPDVFAKMAYRGASGGLLMVIAYRRNRLESLAFGGAPFLLVVEEAEKPGNLGAILRTADAAGVDAVLVPTPPDHQGTDLHNPNVIRASLGAYRADCRGDDRRDHRLVARAGDHRRRRRPGGRDALYGRQPDRAGGFGRGQRGVGIERYVAGGGRRACAHPHGWSSGQFESVGLGGAADVRGGAAAREY